MRRGVCAFAQRFGASSITGVYCPHELRSFDNMVDHRVCRGGDTPPARLMPIASCLDFIQILLIRLRRMFVQERGARGGGGEVAGEVEAGAAARVFDSE